MPPDDANVEVLDAHVRRAGIEALLPARISGVVRLEGDPVVRDALTLPGGCVLAVVQSGDEVVVAPLVPGPEGVRRALAGDGAFSGIARVVRAGEDAGRFEVRTYDEVPDVGDERAIDADQSNDSMVVGERLVVKVYARTAPGSQPGLDLPAHLAAVGFTQLPRPYGALVWTDDGARPVLLATLAEYLPGAEDGWDWYVRLLEGWIDGDVTAAGVEEPADRLGTLVADLHRFLATPSVVFPNPVTFADATTTAAWRRRAEATLDEALELTQGEVGERLTSVGPEVRRALADLDAVDRTPVMRIHGDLHVGQTLRWDGGYAVSDFDGNPLAPLDVRTAPDAAARDVASMARALDHVGRVVQRRRPVHGPDVDGWIGDVRTRFLAAYRAGLGAEGHLFDERLLRPFEVAQECHEHVYAVRYLPRWAYVPDVALPALLAERS